jgi:hypothetical protein
MDKITKAAYEKLIKRFVKTQTRIKQLETENKRYNLTRLNYDSEIKYILGRPNFQVANIAKVLIRQGLYQESLEHKAEAEQSMAIHFMLIHYFKYGSKWKDEMEKTLEGKNETI